MNEIYESEGIKDIPTARFSEIIADEQMMMTAHNQSSLMFSFYSDDSYEPIKLAPEFAKLGKKKLNVNIPSLNLNIVPDYETSSSEEEDNLEEHEAVVVKDTIMYNKNMKSIENVHKDQAKYGAHYTTPDSSDDIFIDGLQDVS